MTETMGLPKPGDVFIGVIDFFAILVPGLAAAMLAAWAKGLVPAKPDALFFAVMLLAGFVLGHILHGIGSFLDVLLYDPLFKPALKDGAPSGRLKVLKKALKYVRSKKYFRSNDDLYFEALRFTSAGGERQPPLGGMYQWARAWLRMHSPEATAVLDRLEADSKLFRSLAVLGFAVVAAWDLFPHLVAGELPLTILTVVFSLWRYCDLRHKMLRTGYLHYIQLHSEFSTLSKAVSQGTI